MNESQKFKNPLFLLDCEQSLFGQSRLSSAGLERANSRERGKRECEASKSRGEAGEKAGKEGGTLLLLTRSNFSVAPASENWIG